VLAAARHTDPLMTIEKCATLCSSYTTFGLEYYTECYCSNSLDASSVKQATDAPCSYACGGDPNEPCGGPALLTVYEDQGRTAPVEPPVVAGFAYKSCWADNPATRSLTGASYKTPGTMTVELCAARCNGFSYFGIEFGNECFCGNALGAAAAPESECAMLCDGNNGQYCGGPDRLNVYQIQQVVVVPPKFRIRK